MPKVNYGTSDEPSFELSPSNDLIAVRTRSRRSIKAGPVQPAAAGQVDDGKLVLAFPEAGVEVYRVPAKSEDAVDERKAALKRDPDVQFAGRVLVDGAGEPVVYTENLFIKFRDDADPNESQRVLMDAGLTVKRKLDYATNAFFASAPEGTGQKVFDMAQALLLRKDVEYAHPELVRRKARRAISPKQWHLAECVVGAVAIKAHANVKAAHAITLGEGVVIAVIDDGIDVDHPEFAGNGKVVAPRDVTFGLDHPLGRDPRPKDTTPDPEQGENHGTACAGVACASGVDGASGVAPAAKLMPIRFAGGLGSQQEADAFVWAAKNGADVISCSWGPADGRWWNPSDPRHHTHVALPASTRLAIDFALTNGRGGKGCVVLFAAGNGNESVDNDGYASYEKVIAVAACNDRGVRSVYSDFGNAVWCAFPSSDFAWDEQGRPAALTPGIWTTDRMALFGYNPGSANDGDLAGSYTNSFGGTSSACPGAAGIVALMLSVNPGLKGSEVKQLLQKACDRIDVANGNYQNDRSAWYGFGRLNAVKAVEVARPVLKPTITVSKVFNQPLLDLQRAEATLEIAENHSIDRVAVDIDIKHTFIGDLVLTLVPPNGANPVVLHNRGGGATKDLRRTFDIANTPALAGYQNTSSQGTWRLHVKDEALRDTGLLVSFGLAVQLTSPS